MNREILFRGKSEVNGEWREGYYFKTIVGEHELHCIMPFGQIVKTLLDNRVYQITQETLGQYTGLTDKNGTRIFEGDIVKVFDKCNERWADGVAVIKFSYDYAGGWIVDDPVSHANFTIGIHTDIVEVIGNIHDNPELLERSVQ